MSASRDWFLCASSRWSISLCVTPQAHRSIRADSHRPNQLPQRSNNADLCSKWSSPQLTLHKWLCLRITQTHIMPISCHWQLRWKFIAILPNIYKYKRLEDHISYINSNAAYTKIVLAAVLLFFVAWHDVAHYGRSRSIGFMMWCVCVVSCDRTACVAPLTHSSIIMRPYARDTAWSSVFAKPADANDKLVFADRRWIHTGHLVTRA